jgi:hypothetical protein
MTPGVKKKQAVLTCLRLKPGQTRLELELALSLSLEHTLAKCRTEGLIESAYIKANATRQTRYRLSPTGLAHIAGIASPQKSAAAAHPADWRTATMQSTYNPAAHNAARHGLART